jgi:hypothetical protein
MSKPDILGIKAFETGPVLQEWWQWALIAIISASGLVGVLSFLWYSYRSIRSLLKVCFRNILHIINAYNFIGQRQ